ncbi:MAG: flagellar FliJ family protein [Proteobacteria bacterium]|nr:flagellar FliJ family protein [Pseudomonadota bacterium]MDA1311167.1 flagellar FliJ family protein [Pseudomonadota bacterium]
MSQYDQLVRLRDWELDEKKRALAEIQAEIQALIDKRQALEDEVVREQAVAASSYESSIGYSAFANAVIQRRQDLDQEILEREQDAAAANEELLVTFQELRKAEIVRDDYDATLKLEEARREQLELDEISQNVYRRNKR